MSTLHWIGGVLLVSVAEIVAADACHDFYAAVQQRARAEDIHEEARAERAVGIAAKAVRKTIAAGPAAEVLHALESAFDWWWVAQMSAVEWSDGNDDEEFEALFEHLAKAFLAIDRAHQETTAGVCVLRNAE